MIKYDLNTILQYCSKNANIRRHTDTIIIGQELFPEQRCRQDIMIHKGLPLNNISIPNKFHFEMLT